MEEQPDIRLDGGLSHFRFVSRQIMDEDREILDALD